MSDTYDVGTDIGKVRLLIPDREIAEPVFHDDEITAFLGLEGASVYRAAALGLETIASDTAMTLRVTRTLGLDVDGAKASDALLKRAAGLRKQADEADARDGGMFDVAELAIPPFGDIARLRNELLRSGF